MKGNVTKSRCAPREVQGAPIMCCQSARCVRLGQYVDSGDWFEDLRKNLRSEPLMIKDIENTIMSYGNA